MSARPALALAALLAALPALAQPRSAGERAFERCIACHALAPAERGLPGPNLHGVLGRQAGALAGFGYSPEMKAAGAAGLVWTEETLARFLADPEAVVPGTWMSAPGLDAAGRAAVIELLEEAR